MKVLNDFRCVNGHTHEHFVDFAQPQVLCQTCGLSATKVIRPIRSVLEPHSGSFPGATEKWINSRYKRMAKEKKAERDHGSDVIPK